MDSLPYQNFMWFNLLLSDPLLLGYFFSCHNAQSFPAKNLSDLSNPTHTNSMMAERKSNAMSERGCLVYQSNKPCACSHVQGLKIIFF